MNHRYTAALLCALVLALPAMARQDDEKPTRKGWLGVSIQDVTERIQKKYKLPSDDGAYIADVVDESPADSAGLKEGDVIVGFGDRTIADADDLSRAVERTAPGSKVNITVMRDGSRKTIAATLGKQRRDTAFAFAMPHMGGMLRTPFPGHGARVWVSGQALGLSIQTLNEQLAEYFGAPNNEGVLIASVEKNSAGDKAGLKAGDVIVKFGKRTVQETEDITRELARLDEGDKVDVEVLRKGARKTLSVEVGEQEGMKFFRDHGARLEGFVPEPPEIDENVRADVEDAMRDLRFEMERIRPQVEQTRRELLWKMNTLPRVKRMMTL